MEARGKFIVICGTDGSGKTTQFDLLKKRMEAGGELFETVDFPQYGKPSAYFVEKYLNGEYGSAADVGPYCASLFYALDRYEKSFDMHRTLASGRHIIANRYVSASMGHQASKIKNSPDREKYLAWLENLEYGICGIPRPDLTIILFVPPELGQKLVEKKTTNRTYLKNGRTKDINEADLNHLQEAAEAYAEMVQRFPDWTRIDCVREGTLLSKETISDLVWEKARPLFEKINL